MSIQWDGMLNIEGRIPGLELTAHVEAIDANTFVGVVRSNGLAVGRSGHLELRANARQWCQSFINKNYTQPNGEE